MIPKQIAILSGTALIAFSASAPARAALLNFDLSGSRNATFQLDSNPTPSSFSSSAFGDQIQFSNVAGIYAGVAGVDSISFASGPIFADLNINGTQLGFTQFAGPTIFSGTAAAPIFAPGVFSLTSIVSGASTLTITEAPASGPSGAVPEPATWALMIGGFGLTGAALRHRRRTMIPARA